MNARVAAMIVSLWALPGLSMAADTGQVPCRTTAECMAQAARIGGASSARGAAGSETTSKTDQAEDQFHWVNKINKASSVMLVEEKLLSRDTARAIARGINHAIEQAGKPEGKRPSDVMQIERIITDATGPDGSLIHAGRSRQDMLATYRMARLRNQVLDFSDALNAMRDRVVAAAAKNVDTIIPAYTNGVQAQPISYAHYLLAYEASFERDAQRIRDLYGRLNRSAMGTAVLANSSWPLNRMRLAELLGFDGIIENSLDSSQVSPFDITLEASAIASSTAIRIGAIAQDLHTQYHQTRPWMLLDEGLTYSSSAMPQKRNPGLIMRVREAASDVVGFSQMVTMRAHNVATGMTDYKETAAEIGLFPRAIKMVAAFNAVLDVLQINARRALEELEDDWVASMELAETLQKDHRIPYRVGHSFSSDIVGYARANGIKPRDFPYAKAEEFYAKAVAKHKLSEAKLPIRESEFRQILSPEHMVKSRVGIGGPQPAEVERMLAKAQTTLRADRAWVQKTRQNLKDADASLDKAFTLLLAE